MTEEIRIKMDNESLGILLRSNLSCYMGKNITQDLLFELAEQIIESIDYFINQKEDGR